MVYASVDCSIHDEARGFSLYQSISGLIIITLSNVRLGMSKDEPSIRLARLAGTSRNIITACLIAVKSILEKDLALNPSL